MSIYFQVVGKAAKPIPVLVLGVLIGHKSYPLKKYLFIMLIVLGVVLFMFKDQAKKSGDVQGFGIGEVLLLLSLTMDGLTGAVQVHITSSYHSFFNFWWYLFLALFANPLLLLHPPSSQNRKSEYHVIEARGLLLLFVFKVIQIHLD